MYNIFMNSLALGIYHCTYPSREHSYAGQCALVAMVSSDVTVLVVINKQN